MIITQDKLHLKSSTAKWKIPDGVKNALASGVATGIVKAALQPFGNNCVTLYMYI